jgi:hypothetical protein
MDRLRERVEQELDAIAVADRPISDVELVAQLAPEFSSVCGQADVRAAVVMAMRRRLHYRARPKMTTGTLPADPISRESLKSS